jgi:hypothetical protein
MKRLLIIILILFLVITGFFIYAFRTQVEKLHVKLAHEKIFLKHLSRGVSYEVNVLSKYSYTKAEPNILKEYVDWGGRSFFYDIKRDTLFIYGGDWCNSAEKLISRIKFISIKDSILYYRLNYKQLGLKVFPPSSEKFLN